MKTCELFRADVAPHRAGAQRITTTGLFGDRVAAVAAAAELLPGEADFNALHAKHRIVALVEGRGGTPVRNVDHAVLADLSAALRSVATLDPKRLAREQACHVAPLNLPAGRRRR